MIILGIDPGIEGAYVAIDGTGALVETDHLPILAIRHGKGSRNEPDAHALWDLIHKLRPNHVFIEDVHVMPKQGIVGAGRFMLSVGLIRMAVVAAGAALTPIKPDVWQEASPDRQRPRRRTQASQGAIPAAGPEVRPEERQPPRRRSAARPSWPASPCPERASVGAC
jgi:hypothetical protein